MVPQPLSAARHDNVHKSSKACLVHFWFPHANANRHNHTKTNARRKGHLWIHYYESGYSNRKAADDSHGRRRGMGGERDDAADDLLIMQLHTSSFFLQSDRDSSTCQCAAETLKWKIHLEVPRELHWHSWSSLPPPRPPPPHMCMHIHTPLSPSSIHPFSLNYALWLFVSVFLQKLPGETRVEEPIACSQQIKKACVFFFLFPCDVFVGGNSLSCAAGQGWGSWLWGERERERGGSSYFHITLIIAQQVSPQHGEGRWCIKKEHLAEWRVVCGY